MMKHITKAIIIMAASSVANSAYAATPLQLSSDVFVERIEKNDNGSSKVVLEKPTTVLPGDNLVFIVNYKNASSAPASNLTVTNPLPAPVQFNGTSDGTEIVSVDDGKVWGPLQTLSVKEKDGVIRPANMKDVTHIRWTLRDTLTAGETGKLIFRGIVK